MVPSRGASHRWGNRTQVARAGCGESETYFDRALAVARKQQAKSWELRAAMSMARLWHDQVPVGRDGDIKFQKRPPLTVKLR